MSLPSMRAIGVIPKKREVCLFDSHPHPVIRSDFEVKVKALEIGICGTDREICTFVYGSPPVGQDYLVIGHESLGEVVEVGAEVNGLKPGDLVVPSVRRPCADPFCQSCQADLQDFCFSNDFRERGIKGIHGFMTEFYVDHSKYLNTVPSSLRDCAVLVEPLTVAEKALAQVWKTQARLPWIKKNAPAHQPGKGLNAVVLGAGPIGILGAMALVARGFRTFVYSRSRKPNMKAELVESFGATYISSETETPEQLAAHVGNVDLIYEALGVSSVSFDVMRILGMNGVYVFTGIPAPKPAIPVMGDELMRNFVLKNQAIIGSVNADRAAFENAIKDLAIFKQCWPQSLSQVITGRHTLEDYRKLLTTEEKSGIKNVIVLS